MSTCYYCGPTDKELRPYGPGGSEVCFPCATETPDREKAAAANFNALLDATNTLGPAVIGGENGPEVFDPRML